jgi:hypothetical protein
VRQENGADAGQAECSIPLDYDLNQRILAGTSNKQPETTAGTLHAMKRNSTCRPLRPEEIPTSPSAAATAAASPFPPQR